MLDTARHACPFWLVGRGKEKKSLLTILELALFEALQNRGSSFSFHSVILNWAVLEMNKLSSLNSHVMYLCTVLYVQTVPESTEWHIFELNIFALYHILPYVTQIHL